MSYVDNVIEQVKEMNPNEPEFIQAVTEVLTSLKPVIESNPASEKAGLLERIDNGQAVARPPLVCQPGDCRVDRLVLGAVEVRRPQIGLDPLDRASVRHQGAEQVLLDLDSEMLPAHTCTPSRRY